MSIVTRLYAQRLPLLVSIIAVIFVLVWQRAGGVRGTFLSKHRGRTQRGASVAARSKWRDACDYQPPLAAADMPPVATPTIPPRRMRSLYVTVLSGRRMDEFARYWSSRDKHLLTAPAHLLPSSGSSGSGGITQRDSNGWLPSVADQLIVVEERDVDWALGTFEKLNWTKVRDLSDEEGRLDCEEAQVDVALDRGWHSGHYRTPAGAHIIVVVRKFRRPRWMAGLTDSYLASGCGPLQCCEPSLEPVDQGRRSDKDDVTFRTMFDHVLYNLAYVFHVLVDMPLLDSYDYLFKMDADVEFLQPVPLDVGDDMARRGCSFMHSKTNPTRPKFCSLGSRILPALASYTQAYDLYPASGHTRWCNSSAGINDPHSLRDYFYGNWVGGAIPWLRSHAVRAFLWNMYHNHPEHWGESHDQGTWLALVCQFLDTAPPFDQPPICEYKAWRKNVFKHW